MSKKIRPLQDRVLVERIESESRTQSGIYIPDGAQEKAQTAKVIAVGAGRLTPSGELIPVAVKAGEIVFFGKYAGTEAGDNRLIIKEDEILGVVEQ